MKAKLLFTFFFLFILFTVNAQNLIAYYPFNGDANDVSGNNHNGTVYGATLTTDRFGTLNSAYKFDGLNNYIDIGDWENGGPMSFTFWARWDGNHNYSRIIDLGNGSSSNNIVVSQRQSNNELFFSIYLGSSETKMYTTTTLSQWSFYAATVDASGIMTLYKNGEQIAQKTDGVTPNLILRTQQFIGKSNFAADGYFEGAIDELKIYDKALTATEVKNDYKTLIAYYPFNGNANDESGNGNNGTVNGATQTTDRFGNANSAYYFNGVDNYILVQNSNSLDITGNELTISMWLYNDNPDSSNLWKGISKGGFDLGNGYELIFTNYPSNSNGKLALNAGSGGYNLGSFNNYNNQWLMLTGTFNNGVGKVYINGVEQATTLQGTANLISSTSDLFIGQRNPANNFDGFVKGKIDGIRIYNKALTATEVLSLFTNTALKVEKYDTVTESTFYVNNNTLYFKKTQNLQEIEAIEVYNLLGQKVYNTSKIKNEIIFKTMPIGVYILKVKNINNTIYTLRFLIN